MAKTLSNLCCFLSGEGFFSNLLKFDNDIVSQQLLRNMIAFSATAVYNATLF